MAATLATSPHSLRTSYFFRSSFTLFRTFTSAPQNPTPTTTTPNKSKRRKKKNLFEVAQFLPNWGIGYRMQKTHWSDVSYEITKINLYKDGRHGKAWGIVHKNGLPAADAPKKISGVHKRCWRYITNSVKSSQSSTNSTASADSGLKTEAQAS